VARETVIQTLDETYRRVDKTLSMVILEGARR
jgi:hypothetical protein